MAFDPIAEFGRQLDNAAADPSLTPHERLVKLRELRDRCSDMVGAADRHIADVHALSEADVARSSREVLRARELADIAEALELDGVESGLPTHRDLDALAEEGLLEEALPALAAHGLVKFDPLKHPHGTGGRFEQTEDMPKKAPEIDMHGQPVDERYHDYFKDDPEAIIASMDRLHRTREDTPEHIAKARRNLDRAKRGLILKRKPLSVAENGDGTLSIIDGNSTHAALEAEGLTHLPVVIDHQVTDPSGAAVDRVADEIATKAEAAEKDVTPAIKNVIEASGGRMEGLEHRLKTRDSIKSKIARKQEKYPGLPANLAGEKVKDALRYTAVLPDERYVEGVKGVQSALKSAGYDVGESKNFWGGADDYDGYHAILHGPGGHVELQFHTDASLAAKNKLHPLFAQFRESADSKERYQLWQQMKAITAKTPMPPGVEALGPAMPSPSKEQAARRHEGFE